LEFQVAKCLTANCNSAGATAPVPFADQTNLQSSETTSVDVCATGVNLSRRESIVLSPPRRASPTRRETICLIPSSRTGTPVPVLPPLSIYQRTPQSYDRVTAFFCLNHCLLISLSNLEAPKKLKQLDLPMDHQQRQAILLRIPKRQNERQQTVVPRLTHHHR